jgi:hypothetical protein
MPALVNGDVPLKENLAVNRLFHRGHFCILIDHLDRIGVKY